MEHIAVDCGREEVKTVWRGGYRDKFQAYVGTEEPLKLKNSLRPTEIILRTPTGGHFIGELAEECRDRRRMMVASKAHLDTKLLVSAAVARAVPDGWRGRVVTGVPVDYHQKEKGALVELLGGAYVLEINNGNQMVHKRFCIDDVVVAVEGASAYVQLCAGQTGIKRFLDLGSRTVNYGTVVNGRYLSRESGTLDYGVRTERAAAQAMARRIAADLSPVWKDTTPELYVLGGGAESHVDALRQYFENARCATEPQFVNALAFFKIGEAVAK